LYQGLRLNIDKRSEIIILRPLFTDFEERKIIFRKGAAAGVVAKICLSLKSNLVKLA